jgi:hypothetical protein
VLPTVSQWLPRVKLLGAAIAVAMFTGCAGNAGTIPNQPTFSAFNASTSLEPLDILPDKAKLPTCKGQKNTKEYAKAPVQDMKEAGGSLCVPAFGGWGGALQYPQTYSTAKYSVTLVSSTTAYKGALLPPAGSKKPILYLQVGFNSFPGFYPTLPKGNPVVSKHLVPEKPYTVELFIYFYGLGWSEENSCYQVAAKWTGGGSLASVGAVFEKVTFLEKNGAIEIFPGELVSNKCS